MERLARLIEEDECSAKCEKYADELKKLSEEMDKTILCEFGPKFFKALADHNRLKILKMLAVREMCVCELNVALDISQGTISHHLKILQEAKLIKGRVKGKWNYYRVYNEQIDKFIKKSEQVLKNMQKT